MGTTVVHDNKVIHGVAPVSEGIRYTLILFYRPFSDMRLCINDDKKEWDEHSGQCYCVDGFEPDFSAEVEDNHLPCVPIIE